MLPRGGCSLPLTCTGVRGARGSTVLIPDKLAALGGTGRCRGEKGKPLLKHGSQKGLCGLRLVGRNSLKKK